MPSSWRQWRLHDEISTEWKNVTICWEYESLDRQSDYPSISRFDRRIIIVLKGKEMVVSPKAILTVSDFWGRHISNFLLCLINLLLESLHVIIFPLCWENVAWFWPLTYLINNLCIVYLTPGVSQCLGGKSALTLLKSWVQIHVGAQVMLCVSPISVCLPYFALAYQPVQNSGFLQKLLSTRIKCASLSFITFVCVS